MVHAGEVTAEDSSITGNVVDGSTNTAVVGGTTIVALEQKDSSGVDRVTRQTTAQADGSFAFSLISSGTYDIVAAAVDGNGVDYAATITTGIQTGSTVKDIPLLSTGVPPSPLIGMVLTFSADG